RISAPPTAFPLISPRDPLPARLHRPASRHLPVLHSFPTRRSSDLPSPTGRGPSARAERTTGEPQRMSHPPSQPSADLGRAAVPRSEEHTSELQSRFDLVCRLLLEKKKVLRQGDTRVVRAHSRHERS